MFLLFNEFFELVSSRDYIFVNLPRFYQDPKIPSPKEILKQAYSLANNVRRAILDNARILETRRRKINLLKNPPIKCNCLNCNNKLAKPLSIKLPDSDCQGPNGLVGETGDLGKIGEMGENGNNGKNGLNGTDGAIGEKGPPGFEGFIGLPGLSGDDGINGKTGDIGEPGEQGDVGESYSKQELVQLVKELCRTSKSEELQVIDSHESVEQESDEIYDPNYDYLYQYETTPTESEELLIDEKTLVTPTPNTTTQISCLNTRIDFLIDASESIINDFKWKQQKLNSKRIMVNYFLFWKKWVKRNDNKSNQTIFSINLHVIGLFEKFSFTHGIKTWHHDLNFTSDAQVLEQKIDKFLNSFRLNEIGAGITFVTPIITEILDQIPSDNHNWLNILLISSDKSISRDLGPPLESQNEQLYSNNPALIHSKFIRRNLLKNREIIRSKLDFIRIYTISKESASYDSDQNFAKQFWSALFGLSIENNNRFGQRLLGLGKTLPFDFNLNQISSNFSTVRVPDLCRPHQILEIEIDKRGIDGFQELFRSDNEINGFVY